MLAAAAPCTVPTQPQLPGSMSRGRGPAYAACWAGTAGTPHRAKLFVDAFPKLQASPGCAPACAACWTGTAARCGWAAWSRCGTEPSASGETGEARIPSQTRQKGMSLDGFAGLSSCASKSCSSWRQLIHASCCSIQFATVQPAPANGRSLRMTPCSLGFQGDEQLVASYGLPTLKAALKVGGWGPASMCSCLYLCCCTHFMYPQHTCHCSTPAWHCCRKCKVSSKSVAEC